MRFANQHPLLLILYSTLFPYVLAVNRTEPTQAFSDTTANITMEQPDSTAAFESALINATASLKKTGAGQSCAVMTWYKEADFHTGCHFSQGINGFTLISMRLDGSYVIECWCDRGLDSYIYGSPEWVRYNGKGISRISKYARGLNKIAPHFNGISCGSREQGLKSYDSKTGFCAMF